MNWDLTDQDILNIDSDILAKAWDGDAAAQLKLGKAYFNSVYIEVNCLNAFKWFFQSAQQGNMEAQFKLGDLYALGQGTKKSSKDAYLWYTKAALQGYKKALIRIRNLYQEDKKMNCRGQLNSDEEEWASGEFKKKNNIRELNEYRRVQQASILNNAIDYYTDQFKLYKSSDQEDVEAHLYLGFFYQHGFGIRQNMLLTIDFYTKAAERGHKDAQYNLGYLYQHNTDIKFNYRHALKWYTLSANNGNIAAQNCLGYFYEKGLDTELNYKDALYWYSRAAISGNSSAQLTLGKLYRKGQGVEQNISEAVKWYKLAASQGNNVAQNCLNQLYLNEKLPKTTETDTISDHTIGPPTAFTLRNKLQNDINKLCDLPEFKKLKKLAQRALMTDGNAMLHIGMKYYNSLDFLQDKNAGLWWIKKAAQTGLQEAQFKLIGMYETGDVIDQEFYESSIWIQKLVKKKNDEAQCRLGLRYIKGFGVRKDPLEASKWFIKSGDQGNAEAQYQFGLLKYDGLGVRKDKEEAAKWFFRSVQQKNLNSLWKAGQLYETGNIWERDNHSAIKYYTYSANHGHRVAQFRLGEIYEKGEFAKQDLEIANKYYTLAANSGDPLYQINLAFKYINEVFEDVNYIKAFDLIKSAAERNNSVAKAILTSPIERLHDVKDHSKIISMLFCASKRGAQGLDYTIGYTFEHGIKDGSKYIFNIDYAKAIECYTSANSKGDSRAQYRLGVMCEEGKGGEVDFNSAFEYYSQAYENGNCDAAYGLGLMYLNGNGVSQDLVKAFYLFREASEMGHKNAYKKLTPSHEENTLPMLAAVASLGYVAIQYQLGVFYEHKDDFKPFAWFNLAIQGKISDAYYRLGVLYEEGRGTVLNYSKAFYFYNQAACQGHNDSMYRLGQMYHYGVGTKLDYESAYKWYSRAAKSNHRLSLKVLNITTDRNLKIGSKTRETSSSSNFGNKNISDSFPSTSDEFKYSIIMYKYIAEQGDIEAQYTLGIAYEYAFKIPDYREAAKWYTMAAKNIHGNSMYHLGLLYERGLGVVQDYQKASQLYRDAYKQGNYDALYKLAVAYQSGTGVDIDSEKAIQYYTEAANYGQVNAQYSLGVLYEQGNLVEQNILLALKWCTIAYLQGSDEAGRVLYNHYDNPPYEFFFYQKLFVILIKSLRFDYAYQYQVGEEAYGQLRYRLGYLYLNGLGTRQNYPEAWKLITESVRKLKFNDIYGLLELDSVEKVEIETEAADDGDEDAQYSIGKYHYIKATQEHIRLQGQTNTAVDNNLTEFNDDDPISHHYKKAIHYFSLAAANGHPDSQFYLGKIYQNGYGTAKDYEQAKTWYSEASEKRHPGARHSLGMLYLNDITVEKDFPEALLNLGKSVQEGNEYSSFQLGWMHEHSLGILKDESEALTHFQNFIKVSEMKSNSNYNFEDLSNVADDSTNQGNYQNLEDISLADLTALSDNGIGKASYLLSQKYFNGIGVDQDKPISINYLRKAAHQGHVFSQEELALAYYSGNGVVKDFRMATMWFRAAVKNGNELSMLYLGQIYHCGLVDKPDFFGAFELYRSIEGVYRDTTLREIGLLYEYGNGFKVDQNLALHYYRESFKKGNTISGYNIALLYFNGKSVKQDYKGTLYWLERALYKPAIKDIPYLFIEAENNQTKATSIKYTVISYNAFVGEINYLLGRIYYEGLGVQQDTDKSYRYFLEANEKGKAEAKAQLKEIEETREIEKERVLLMEEEKAKAKSEGKKRS